MSKDSEPRSYSVEEMMEKLKKGKQKQSATRDKELVTRADGSQVTRVRKRKRRTQQSKRKAKPVHRKKYGLYAVIALILLVVVGGISIVTMLARFNSRGFREDITASVSSASGAAVRINDLSVNPIKTRVQSVEMTWPRGGMTRALTLTDLETRLNLSSFFRSRLEGAELYARSATMRLGPVSGSPSMIRAVEPEDFFSFGHYRCNQFDLAYGMDSREAALQIRDSELVVRERSRNGGMQFQLSGGFLRFGNWCELKVQNGLGEWHDGSFHLVSLRTQSEEGGKAVFKGVQPIAEEGVSSFDVDLTEFPLEQLLGEKSLGRMLSARVDSSSGALSVNSGTEMNAQVEVAFTGKDSSIEGFRFLGGLASILRKEHYSRPEGGTISGVLRRDLNQLTIENLRYEIRSHMVLTGTIVVKDEEMSGELRLGVPEALMMKTLDQPRYSSFSQPAQGYCWTDLQLSGSLDQPNDDFLKRLQASPVESEAPLKSDGQPVGQ